MSSSIYPNIRQGNPTPGVWYPYGSSHRVIFEVDGTFRVWDSGQWYHLGDRLFSRVQAWIHAARNAPEGDLMVACGWDHVTPGKLTGMIMDACSTSEVVHAITDDACLVPWMVAACEALE
jgi:hypothetical protein